MTTAITTTAWAAETAQLNRLIERGWLFLTIPGPDTDELQELRAGRVWPDRWLDAVRMTSSTSAEAQRINPDNHLVWYTTGTCVEVIDKVLDLPPPDHSAAPRRVLAWASPYPTGGR